MQVEIFTFCDAATDYEGRMSILGATDRFVAPYLPFRHNNSAVALRMRAVKGDEGQHIVHIALIDAERRAQLDVSGEIEFHLPPEALSGVVQMIVNMQGLDFLVEGEYTLLAEVDGRTVARTPLMVRVRQD